MTAKHSLEKIMSTVNAHPVGLDFISCTFIGRTWYVSYSHKACGNILKSTFDSIQDPKRSKGCIYCFPKSLSQRFCVDVMNYLTGMIGNEEFPAKKIGKTDKDYRYDAVYFGSPIGNFILEHHGNQHFNPDNGLHEKNVDNFHILKKSDDNKKRLAVAQGFLYIQVDDILEKNFSFETIFDSITKVYPNWEKISLLVKNKQKLLVMGLVKFIEKYLASKVKVLKNKCIENGHEFKRWVKVNRAELECLTCTKVWQVNFNKGLS